MNAPNTGTQMNSRLLLQGRRGFYSIITTFFFILITLAVVVGLIYYLGLVNTIKERVNKEQDVLTKGRIVRDALFACYGATLDEGLITSGSCRNAQNLTFTDEFALAWAVRTYPYKTCTQQNFTSTDIDALKGLWRNRIIYTVPVVQASDRSTCPAQLEIYIK
ncbi:MAG: hypothetical protein HC945_00390 [Nitrosarchaeum sp.]|nr:hypothetical protein [Nitrosarchaeum sp.]